MPTTWPTRSPRPSSRRSEPAADGSRSCSPRGRATTRRSAPTGRSGTRCGSTRPITRAPARSSRPRIGAGWSRSTTSSPRGSTTARSRRRSSLAGGPPPGGLRQRAGGARPCSACAPPATCTESSSRRSTRAGPREGGQGQGGMSEEPIRTLPALGVPIDRVLPGRAAHDLVAGWILVGHVSSSRAGRLRQHVRIAGEPIAVVVGADGELRGFSNVCRHRAARVLDGTGNCGKAHPLPLPRLDIRARRAPAGRAREDRLPGVRARGERALAGALGVSAGFVFANLAPEPEPLDTRAGPVRRVARALSPRAARELSNGIVRASHQLEELDRQLPRGLPHAGRPPRPAAAARLQELPRRDLRRERLDRPQPDARQGLQRSPRAPLPAAHAAHARPALPGVRAVELRLRVPRGRRSTSTRIRSTSGSTTRSTSGARSRSGTRFGRPRRPAVATGSCAS